MNPTILAGHALAVLMPYVSKGVKQVLETAGEVAHEKLGKLLTTLKTRFSGDEEAAEVIEKFEEKPERYRPVVQDILEEKLKEDEAFASDVAQQVSDIRLHITQIMKEGKDVTGLALGEFLQGDVTVIQRIDKGEGVTGAKIDRIG